MFDRKFYTLVQYLRNRFPLDVLTDLQLLHYAADEISNALRVNYNTHLDDVLQLILPYITDQFHPMSANKSRIFRMKCRLLDEQLMRDFPPQEIPTTMSFGTPGIGKTVYKPIDGPPEEPKIWLSENEEPPEDD